MFLTQVAAEQVAAIIVEPVQEGGFLPRRQAFLEGLRAICDEHGICLIADEVEPASRARASCSRSSAPA